MRVHNRDVGPGHPTLIVAEGGSNHGGSLDAALALTDAAADAGADAMKWQLWLSADEMYDREQFPAEWASADRWRLKQEWLPDLVQRAHERNLAFGLSSFGFASLDVADRFVDFHKIASIEATWEGFVSAVGLKGKPVLISLGGLNSIDADYAWRVMHHKTEVVLMQCTISYPANLEDADIRLIGKWADPEDGPFVAGIGLSDHTTHPTIAPCAAASLGACVIEKHLRNSRTRYPEDQDFSMPDWLHSLTPLDFKKMVHHIRLTEAALGSSEKRIRPSEEKYLRYRRGPKGLRGA